MSQIDLAVCTCVHFHIVAEPVARRRLLLFDSAVTEQKRARNG